MISASEFEQQYAERSGSTVERLRLYRKVVPCGPESHGCDDPSCAGWGMTALTGGLCGECGHYDFKHPRDGCSGFTDERRWPAS